MKFLKTIWRLINIKSNLHRRHGHNLSFRHSMLGDGAWFMKQSIPNEIFVAYDMQWNWDQYGLENYGMKSFKIRINGQELECKPENFIICVGE